MGTLKFNRTRDSIHLLRFIETVHFETVIDQFKAWISPIRTWIVILAIALAAIALVGRPFMHEESSPVRDRVIRPMISDPPKIVPDGQKVASSSDIIGQMKELGVQDHVQRITARADQMLKEMRSR